MENEIWKDIEGYEGIYQVSNLGRVKSLSRFRKAGKGGYIQKEKVVSITLNKSGYCYITFKTNLKTKTISIHRLVAKAFIINTENKPDVNHKNGIKTDNKVVNLEWCTQKENSIHSFHVLGNTKISKLSVNKGKFGKNNRNSKKVEQYNLDFTLIKVWDSGMDINRSLGFNRSAINLCCRGNIKTSYGFIWRFKT